MHRPTVALLAGIGAISASYAAVGQERKAPQAELTRTAAQERAAQAFTRMDVNSDGKIDAADREARVKARFDRIDADGNGTIDLAEYTVPRASRGERAQGRGGERMGRRGMRGGGMGMDNRGPIRGADANEDGIVTGAELQSASLARFDAVDADKNGIVTAAERKAHREAGREKRRERRASSAG